MSKPCEKQSPSWIYPLFPHPLDKCAITLTSHRCESLAISPDGKILICGNYDGTIKLWSLEKENCCTHGEMVRVRF
ncbi:hypothetical protein [Nostoc sp.]|uniref:hypothetical protein n=1 Tax=Nostoc sp. TaxID=1180 RepID=UPI003FA541D9